MSRAAVEADRKIGNMIRIGKVVSVDAGAARADVACGDLTVPGCAVSQFRAGALSFWWMPTIGEQVVIASPAGEMAQAVILCSVFAGNAPSSDAAVPVIALGGGQMRVEGDLIVTGDVVAGGISLTTHTHSGVTAGGSNTGGPQ